MTVRKKSPVKGAGGIMVLRLPFSTFARFKYGSPYLHHHHSFSTIPRLPLHVSVSLLFIAVKGINKA